MFSNLSEEDHALEMLTVFDWLSGCLSTGVLSAPGRRLAHRSSERGKLREVPVSQLADYVYKLRSSLVCRALGSSEGAH